MNRIVSSLAALAAVALASLARRPRAAQPIKLGELNSYKVFPAFLEPYKKGMELALAEINAAGGVLGRPLEIVVARRQRQRPATPCASPRSCSRARRSRC